MGQKSLSTGFDGSRSSTFSANRQLHALHLKLGCGCGCGYVSAQTWLQVLEPKNFSSCGADTFV
jgi:hypothetical protein